MAPGATASTAAHLTKRYYLKNPILPTDLAKQEHVLVSMMKEVSNYFGEDAFYSFHHTNPQAVSGKFTTAFTQSETEASSPDGEQLRMTDATQYGRITVDGKAILKTKNSQVAFAKLWRGASEGTFQTMGTRMARSMYGDGNGVFGQRASISSNTITLAGAHTARNFERRMTLTAGPNADGSSLRAGSTTVTKVNLADNTITVADASAITSFANDDFLFAQDSEGPLYNPLGLEGHVPLVSPPSGESFRGIDRSDYPERMAGIRLANPTGSLEENLGLAAILVDSNGPGKAKCAFVNSRAAWSMATRLGAKTSIQEFKRTVKYGFQKFRILTPAGVIEVYPDPDCPRDRFWVGDTSDLYWHHSDKPIHIIRDDGNSTTRMTGHDGLEQRWRSVTQTAILRPTLWGVGQVG
jgi:hypothetical protein